MTKQNFLLGKGERLSEDIVVKGGGGPKHRPYTFAQARARLAPRLQIAVAAIDHLPAIACPEDQAIVALTLNPEFIAKSYFPLDMLKATGLQPVGSRPRKIKPEKRSKGRDPEETVTTELFVQGSRDAFRKWNRVLPTWLEQTPVGEDLTTLEDVSAPSPHGKIKGVLPVSGRRVLEVVLHADELSGERFVLPEFRKYLLSLNVETEFEKRFYAGGLCFVELEAAVERADEIAAFSIVRALREMPRLRMLRPTIRSASIPTQALSLPDVKAIDPTIRVAAFDGGVPKDNPVTKWTTPIDVPGVGPEIPEFLRHGVGVTSALLFGHIDPTKPLPVPYANVDHYRVLDDAPGQNPRELYEVLDRIDKVLVEAEYDFINLSLGPSVPIEDDEVHAWTAVLDDRLSATDTLATIAVGNDGEGDAQLKLNRIQVPADCINALAVGACDTPEGNWQRAAYSSVGPGRSPGLIKPDLVEFGGSIQRPFIVIGPDPKPTIEATGGTSFASPSTLRLGTGIRAHFGQGLNLLAIHTLLIHRAEVSEHPREEVGWGRLARTLDDIVMCDDDTIRVVYQGAISPAKYVRAKVPMPAKGLDGMVSITATICYKCHIDPHHPGNYTRAGLEMSFRPNDIKFSREDQVHPDTKSFFGASHKGMSEDELRRDAWKWENCHHATKRFRGSSLSNPCFDIHYNARMEGRNFTPAKPLAYAMVITLHAKNIADLYDQVVRKYATILEPLRPVIDIPVRI